MTNRPGVTLNERAIESLEFIRTTMARSAPFTAVPGRGGMAMGAVGIVAAAAASQQADDWAWLAVWIGGAIIAVPTGLAAMWIKARRHGLSLWSANGRRFLQGFSPPLAAGAVLTVALVSTGRFDLVPATWLWMYGAGVLAGSIASIPVLAWVGAGLMLLGAGAAAAGGAWRDLWLAAGFGGLQIVFGFIIARNHGG
jgi:hypothetical protein